MARFFYMVGRTGFEPVTNWLKANCSTNWANDPKQLELTAQEGAHINDSQRKLKLFFSFISSSSPADQSRGFLMAYLNNYLKIKYFALFI